MNAKKYAVLIAAVILSIAVFSASVTGISDGEKDQIEWFGASTLKGITSICPTVHLFKLQEMKDIFLTQEELQTQVELALRRAGVNVTERDAIGRARAEAATLAVIVSIQQIKYSDEEYLYLTGVLVELQQDVSLARDPKIATNTRTWPLIAVPEPMIAERARLSELVKRRIEVDVNRFLNDYLAANPKEPAIPKTLNPEKKEESLENTTQISPP